MEEVFLKALPFDVALDTTVSFVLLVLGTASMLFNKKLPRPADTLTFGLIILDLLSLDLLSVDFVAISFNFSFLTSAIFFFSSLETALSLSFCLLRFVLRFDSCCWTPGEFIVFGFFAVFSFFFVSVFLFLLLSVFKGCASIINGRDRL